MYLLLQDVNFFVYPPNLTQSRFSGIKWATAKKKITKAKYNAKSTSYKISEYLKGDQHLFIQIENAPITTITYS